jgi:hypothetical protein
MADNIDITPGSGKTVATDDLGAAGHAQRVKAVLGADGTGVDPIAVSAGQDSTGAGVAAVGPLMQFDDASTAAVTENQFAPPRISSRRAQLVEGVASGTAVKVSSTQTPSWTDGVAVTAIATLAKGAVSRSTINLSNIPGMYLTMFIGRTGTTALDVGIAVRVRRTIALSPIMQAAGAPVFAATSDVAAAVSGVCAASGNNAGVTSLTLNAAKTFVAGTSGDIILAVLDSTSVPTTASEFVRQAFPTSTTVKLLDAPTISAHNSTAHNVADKANMWQAWIEGGCIVEVIFDYSTATTGDTVVIGAYAQRLDSMVSA